MSHKIHVQFKVNQNADFILRIENK